LKEIAMKKRREAIKGFTLVELSIVLVIIGLIIGGVLSGKQISTSGKVTNAINALQAYEAQFQTYVQNYGALPGDDANASSRFTKFPTVTEGNGLGDGLLNGVFDSTSENAETRLAWAALRAAELIKGSGGNQDQPTNSFGGIYGFQRGAFNNAITTNVICLSEVPGDAALSIDTRLDDGSRIEGSIMAGDKATDALGESSSYVTSSSYTLCMKM